MPETVGIVRVAPAHSAAVIAGGEGALAAVRGAYSGMRRAWLVQGAGDEWTAIVHRGSRDEALAAAAQLDVAERFAAVVRTDPAVAAPSRETTALVPSRPDLLA